MAVSAGGPGTTAESGGGEARQHEPADVHGAHRGRTAATGHAADGGQCRGQGSSQRRHVPLYAAPAVWLETIELPGDVNTVLRLAAPLLVGLYTTSVV